jgi:hypothetical protein
VTPEVALLILALTYVAEAVARLLRWKSWTA